MLMDVFSTAAPSPSVPTEHLGWTSAAWRSCSATARRRPRRRAAGPPGAGTRVAKPDPLFQSCADLHSGCQEEHDIAIFLKTFKRPVPIMGGSSMLHGNWLRFGSGTPPERLCTLLQIK
ncbi:unnamed protein product [Boreogadus saida]